MVADGHFEGLSEGSREAISLQMNGRPQGSRPLTSAVPPESLPPREDHTRSFGAPHEEHGRGARRGPTPALPLAETARRFAERGHAPRDGLAGEAADGTEIVDDQVRSDQ